MKKVDSETPDTENYKVVVSNCFLYVKKGTMSEPVYMDLSTRYQKEDIKIHFRKIMIKNFTIPVHSQEFLSGNLFPGTVKFIILY